MNNPLDVKVNDEHALGFVVGEFMYFYIGRTVPLSRS
jgi:hypothetical protein